MEIILPWPSPALNPNRTDHWGIKSRIKRLQKISAHWLTVEALQKNGSATKGKDAYSLKVIFHPPDNRRRDVDNYLASLKSALDGIAQALEADDKNFSFTCVEFSEVVKFGKVVVTVSV